MPRKPLKPCRYPGCPKLVEGPYCEEHAKRVAKNYEKYERDPESKKRYGAQWRRIRNLYLHQHPLCEECLLKGVYTKATEIHHRVPLSYGGTHDPSNLESLCHACHSKITADMGDRWHNKGRGTSNL